MLRRILLTSAIAIFALSMTAVAFEFVEDFNAPALNPKVWEMKTEGKASFQIEKGLLTMEAPGVDSGVILYHPRNVQDVDITFEVKLNVQGLVENISLGFIQALLDPQINTEINNNLAATFYFIPDKWYIKQDPIVIGEKPPNPGIEGQYNKKDWNVVRLDYSHSKGKITLEIDGKEAGEVDANKQVKERYFYLTCDPYTSHYTGGVTVDSIKVSGPGAEALAVEPQGKLAVSWGTIKAVR
jgi:hypothetical protein